MKKAVLAIGVAAALCFTSAGVMAEETASSEAASSEAAAAEQEFFWEKYEALAEQMGFKGEFYTFDDYGFEMWIPEGFTQIEELSQEAIDKGYLDGFVTEDGESQITVRLQDYGEDVTFEDILANGEGQYDDSSICTVNGMEMLFLNVDGGESVNIFLGMMDGSYLQFAYVNLDTPEKKTAAGFSQMSIRLLENEEAAG